MPNGLYQIQTYHVAAPAASLLPLPWMPIDIRVHPAGVDANDLYRHCVCVYVCSVLGDDGVTIHRTKCSQDPFPSQSIY